MNKISNAKPVPVQKVEKVLARTSIRKIGNSKGIILANAVLTFLGLEEGSEVEIRLDGSKIYVLPVSKTRKVNTDLSTWASQYKLAIKNGEKPEGDLFEGIANDFDSTGWEQ